MTDSVKAALTSTLPDADMQAAPAALLRAAQRARELARMTNTAVVVMRNGELVEEREAQTSVELASGSPT